jgi:hypothetical protein
MVLGLLGVSYAAHTSFLISEFNITTSKMSFIFNKNNVSVQIQNGADGLVRDLDAEASYNEKQLIISDIGPIDIDEFKEGNAILTINYSIKSEDEEGYILQPASIKTNNDQGYDLGTVELKLMSDTPVWLLKNEGKTWGSRTKKIKKTPDIIYDLLPDNLGEFQVYLTLVPDEKDDTMLGSLVLKQIQAPDLPEELETGLSSLNLPDKIIKDLKKGSSESLLEIEGTYGFVINLYLDQFNVER